MGDPGSEEGVEMMVPMREGTRMTPSQYKVYLWLLAHSKQAGMDSYLSADDPDDFGGRGIAKACGISAHSVKDMLGDLRKQGAIKTVGAIGTSGGVVSLPWSNGRRYVEVETSELMRCFTYGAPFCAAEAYVTLMEPREGSVPGMTEEKGEEAVEWLKAQGLAQETEVRDDGGHTRWLSSKA